MAVRHRWMGCALLALAGCGGEAAPVADPEVFDVALFRRPPRASGPHVRWWWPGGAVDDTSITTEVEAMARLGFGGIELQAFAFGLTPADVAADPRIRTVGDANFLARVRTFIQTARAHGMASTLTVGSGWSSGGVFTQDARPYEIVRAHVDVTGPTTVDVAVPTPAAPGWVAWSNMLFPVIRSFEGPFELVSVVALPIVDGTASPPVVGAPTDVTAQVSGGRLVWDAPAGPMRLSFHFVHRVDHLVAGHAYPTTGGPAYVVDHLDPNGFATLRDELIVPWLDALGTDRPDELFVDSFELVGDLPWSSAFSTRFEQRFGYPIEPELPFVTRIDGESAYATIFGTSAPYVVAEDEHGERVREDYEDLRGTLFAESFLAPLHETAEARGVHLRLQAHGGYEQVLDGYTHADVPESEGLFALGSFDFLSLASSAAHVGGARVVSSESFVSVYPLSANLSPDEMWMLAGRAFAAGINRPMFHGRAHPYQRSNGDRFYPFGQNPEGGNVVTITSDVRWPEEDEAFAYLPEFVSALGRLGYAMTRGEPTIEIAWLLDEVEIPNAAAAHFDILPPEEGESDVGRAIRQAGFTYDRISRAMLASSTIDGEQLVVGRARYDALLIAGAHALEPAGAAAIARATAAGIPVVVVGALPTRARGAADVAARDAAVQASVAQAAGALRTVADADGLAAAFAAEGLVPNVRIVETDCTTVSRRSRTTANGQVVLLFHEFANECQAELAMESPVRRARWLDPRDGSAHRLVPDADGHLSVTLPASRPLVLFVEP